MSIRVGIVGVSGYGGGEALRLFATHPRVRSRLCRRRIQRGSELGETFSRHRSSSENLVIEKWDHGNLPELDVLFASLPTGESQGSAWSRPDAHTQIVDIGGDHRYVDGWTYGLADVWPDQIRGKSRIANPGCYPGGSLTAIAPLIDGETDRRSSRIIIDAKSGVSGAGRGGGQQVQFRRGERRRRRVWIAQARARAGDRGNGQANRRSRQPRITFTPHLIPMTRGILATCYLARRRDHRAVHGSREKVLRAADRSCASIDKPPHTKWASGFEPGFRLTTQPTPARTDHRVGGDRQPRQRRRGTGSAEREPHLRAG